MIGREDREDALLKSALQADERVRVVSEHLTECLMLLEEAPNPEDKELVEGDVSQCLELAQDIAQAAADISRRRDGKEKPFRGKVGQGLQVPLPPVTVPVFAGDYADWPAFEDLYSSVVHTRTDITPAYKMAQLMSRLHGEPHELLTHLAVSDSNYEVAWKILTDRYRNKRLIVDRLLDQWLSIPTITRGEWTSRLVKPSQGDLCPSPPGTAGCTGARGNSRQPRRYNTALESGCAYCRRQATGWQRVRSLLRSGFRGDGVWHSRGVGVFGAWGRIKCECPSSTNCRYCQGAHHPLLCMNRSGGAGGSAGSDQRRSLPTKGGATLPPPQGGAHLRIGHRDRQGTSTDGAHLPKDVGTIPTTAAGAGLGRAAQERGQGHPSQVIAAYSSASAPRPITVLLPTAKIWVWGYGGRTIQVRALLDTGAQGCIVSSKLVSRLGLNVRPSEDEAVGIRGLNVPDIRGQTNFEFALGSTCTGVSYQVSAVVLDEVVGKLPQVRLPPTVRGLTTGLELADPDFDTPGTVDVLLGSDVLGRLWCGRKKVLQETGLVAVDTTGGYVVFGPVWRPQDLPEGDPVLYGSVLSEVLQRFWESEEPPTADRRKPEDDECELFYQYNTARCSSGRFVTRLPFLPNRPALGWIKRFVNNCRKPQAERNFTPVLSPAERMRLYAHWLESSRRNILKRRSGCSGMDVES
ncbi:putative peptidase (DUF1758) domain-containing protein [Phthorimaea operculella]|nr:putative peptidase (DUF1758) domain-containing protein [Phthorimaea operculella]